MNIRQTLALQDMWAYTAGTGSESPDSRKADEWIKDYLDKKNKRLNDLRRDLDNKLNHPPALDKYLRPEMKAAWRADKTPVYDQRIGRVASGGKWAVVSPDGEVISTWATEKEAQQAAWATYKGLSPSSTGATAGAQVWRVSDLKEKLGIQAASEDIDDVEEDEEEEEKSEPIEEEIDAADIFQDPEHGDKTRREFIKHPKPKSVQLADQLRMGDRRPSSHGQGSAGTGGAAGPAGGGSGP